jgi:hypothetical protein
MFATVKGVVFWVVTIVQREPKILQEHSTTIFRIRE